jgi:hypothetical protein
MRSAIITVGMTATSVVSMMKAAIIRHGHRVGADGQARSLPTAALNWIVTTIGSL